MFGEAKSFKAKSFAGKGGGERRSQVDAFQDEDVERMKRLAIRFPGAVLVFSTMKQASELSKQEISRITKLAEWGREYMPERRQTRAPVIVLTGIELFAAYSLQQAWEAAGGRHAEFANFGGLRLENLRVLADLTQQLYLGMPDYGSWQDAKWHQKRARRDALRAAREARPTEPEK